MRDPIEKTHSIQNFSGTGLGDRSPAILQRKCNILESISITEQMKRLKYESDGFISNSCHFSARQGLNIPAIQNEGAFVSTIETAEDLQESALATS